MKEGNQTNERFTDDENQGSQPKPTGKNKDLENFKVEEQSEETEGARNAKRAQEKAAKPNRGRMGQIGRDDGRIDRSSRAKSKALDVTKKCRKNLH